MRVYAAVGDRSGLIRQYQEVNEALTGELGVPPLPATKNLFKHLLTGLEG
jgi:DNA-binding SARP family transcriptional activator